MSGDRRLPTSARKSIASSESDIAVSAAVLWEIVIKKSLGRIRIDLGSLEAAMRSDGFAELPIRFSHTMQLEALPDRHRDPFDRMLIAQAIVESRQIVTHDQAILAYRDLEGFAVLAV